MKYLMGANMADMRAMTDDDVLRAAEQIKARRLHERRLASFEAKETVMIRWDNLGARDGESYTSIIVPASIVEDIVRGHFRELIEGVE